MEAGFSQIQSQLLFIMHKCDFYKTTYKSGEMLINAILLWEDTRVNMVSSCVTAEEMVGLRQQPTKFGLITVHADVAMNFLRTNYKSNNCIVRCSCKWPPQKEYVFSCDYYLYYCLPSQNIIFLRIKISYQYATKKLKRTQKVNNDLATYLAIC